MNDDVKATQAALLRKAEQSVRDRDANAEEAEPMVPMIVGSLIDFWRDKPGDMYEQAVAEARAIAQTIIATRRPRR